MIVVRFLCFLIVYLLFGLLFVEVKCFQTTALLWKGVFLNEKKNVCTHTHASVLNMSIRTWCPLTKRVCPHERNHILLYTRRNVQYHSAISTIMNTVLLFITIFVRSIHLRTHFSSFIRNSFSILSNDFERNRKICDRSVNGYHAIKKAAYASASFAAYLFSNVLCGSHALHIDRITKSVQHACWVINEIQYPIIGQYGCSYIHKVE